MIPSIVTLGAGIILGSSLVKLWFEFKENEETREYGLSWLGLAIALFGLAF